MDETDILKERKERILAYMESEGYVPIKRRDMRAMLSVPQEDREKFESLINELIAEGRVFETNPNPLACPINVPVAICKSFGEASLPFFVSNTRPSAISSLMRLSNFSLSSCGTESIARCRRTECCIRCCIRRKRAKRQMA